VDVQVNKHVVLADALGLGVEVDDDVWGTGTRHVDWQFADRALQVIMQFVTVEVCASLILPSAKAPCATAALIAAAARRIAKLRMHPPPVGSLSGHHSARMLAAHDLFGKPKTAPDQVRGSLFPDDAQIATPS
jgi:hypothetical protein